MSKMSFLEAKNKLTEKHGDSIKIIEYTKMSSRAIFECSICHYVWETVAGSVITAGTGCDKCSDGKNAKNLINSSEKIEEELSLYDCHILPDYEYKGKSSNILVLFSCGHKQITTISSFRNMKEKICYDCKIENIKKSKRLEEEEIINFIESFGFNFLEFSIPYKKSSTAKIKYVCNNNHITERLYSSFRRNPVCGTCDKEKRRLESLGSNSHFWRGGVSGLSMLLEKKITDWKRESMFSCDYKCVITGDRFDHIHHLYPMNKIINEVFENLNLEKRKKIKDFSNEEISKIIEETIRLHDIYPLGVCLRKDIHELFHKIYGNKNVTPEQFYEFVDRIESGEIIINK